MKRNPFERVNRVTTGVPRTAGVFRDGMQKGLLAIRQAPEDGRNVSTRSTRVSLDSNVSDGRTNMQANSDAALPQEHAGDDLASHSSTRAPVVYVSPSLALLLSTRHRQ